MGAGMHRWIAASGATAMFATTCGCTKDRSSDELLSWITYASEAAGQRPAIPDYALDMHTAAGRRLHGRRLPHPDLTRHFQECRQPRRRPERVRRPHGEPVHDSPIELRQILRRDHWFRQHTAQGVR